MMTQDYEPAGTGFEAFSTAWQTFSDYFGKTENMPSSADAFETKYANLDDPSLAPFLANCDVANACAAALGDGGRLRQPADSVLGKLIGFASRARDIAGVYCATLQNLEGMLAPAGGDAQQRADQLKKRLIGDIVPGLVALKADALMLDQQLAPLQARLNAANEAITQTTVLNTANQQIGYLAARLADPASRPTAQERQEYERLRLFVADVDNIFAAGTAAVLALGAVRSQVEKLGKLMGDTRDLLMSVCSAATSAQLADDQWVAGALGMPASLAAWSGLMNDAQRFLREETAP